MINIDNRFLKEATQDQFWFMCHVASFMGKDSTCFPSNQTLCNATGWKVSKMNEVKRSCIGAGFLKVETRYFNQKQTSNVYTVLTDRLSVVVNLKGKSANDIPTTLAAPYHADGTPPATLAAPEVLSILTSSSYADQFKKNPLVRDNFSLVYKLPASKFDDYLAAWISDTTAKEEKYNNIKEALTHFYNFSSRRHQIENRKPGQYNRQEDEKPGVYVRPKNLITA